LTKRIKALRNHIEDAGVIQVIPQCVVKRIKKFPVSGILRGRLEVGNRDTDFLNTQPGTGLDPILG
jgi:hypothetical protein